MSDKINEVAIFGGGCFWCTEAIFKMLNGVLKVEPGYAGGTDNNPNYESVSSGKTGHAEVIRIEFDSNEIKYTDLLTVFFASHDPTTLNRQGNDIGTQYRSIILYTNTDQKTDAESFVREIQNSTKEGDDVVTEIKPFEKFFPAESYHLDYYAAHKGNPYCQLVISPKVEKVQKKFESLLKTKLK